MDFDKSYKQLSTEQKKAVDTIDGPVLVIAGPGTGKTQLLALRAANILKKTDTAPQNILCLTYTEVGARNMRQRLTQFVGKSAYDIQISTYHSFGSEIIRNYGEYFTQFDEDQPVDAIGQNVIMHEIYKELPATNILWKTDVYLKDSLNFISESKRARLAPDDLVSIADANDVFIKKASKDVARELKNFQRISKAAIPQFENILSNLNETFETLILPTIPSLQLLAAEELSRILEEVRESGKTPPLTLWKNKWLIKNSDDAWAFGGVRENKKIRAGAEIYANYLKKLVEKKLFDYDDMILRAIDAIEQNDELRFTLQERYQYIMLDEFQDTNLAQLRLIELLTNNPVNEGRPDVLAVGDDDQAIFSFQGADLGNMLTFHSMFRDVTTITLTDNWRSHTDILTLSENISSQIQERLHKELGFNDKKLIARNPYLPKESRVERHNFKSDIAQFSWIAEQINSEIKKGISPSEIAVIAPRHKHLEPLVPYLNSLAIPVRYDKRENVLNDSRITSLITMAALVSALRDNKVEEANSLWPAVLSAEEWGLPTSSIWDLSWKANKQYLENQENNWQKLMFEDDKLRPISLFFTRLAIESKVITLETMLDHLTGTLPVLLNEADIKEYSSPYFTHYFGEAKKQADPVGFTQLLSNLTVLRQHLRNYKKMEDEPLVLDDLLAFVKAYSDASEKLLNTNPYHSSTNAVQLLTAYGSKGLEFGSVFVLATSDEVWGMKARSKSSNIGLPLNLKIIRHAGSSKDERNRLFYVALTRAKHTLILTSYDQDFSGKEMTNLEFMNETVNGDKIQSPYLPINTMIFQSDEKTIEIDDLEKYWHTRHIAALGEDTFKELIRPHLESFQLSATHVNAFTDLIYGGPESFYLNTILRFPKAPSVSGQYGSAIHETLESLHKILRSEGELPDIDKTISIFEKRLKAKRLSKQDYDQQFSRGKQALEHFLPWWWPHFNPSNLAEMSFRNEGSFVDEAHLNGKLDQLSIDEESRAIQVIDFKTGTPHKRWEKTATLHKYKNQLLFYKLLLENSHSYGKYTVERGVLVFVEPDEDLKMSELSLSYDSEDVARMKSLITAIWNCIMKLDIPPTNKFKKTLQGIKDFEDWLIKTYN